MASEPVVPFPEAPPYVIRQMTAADADRLEQLDWAAFEGYRQRHQPNAQSLRHRTRENLHAALNRPYPGVVLEWPEGKVAGYCFTHIWGSLGWLGTLGVDPPHQGLGFGRAVVSAGLDVLRRAGCSTLALETMPESGRNLGLYARLDLEGRELTLLCQGTPEAAASTTFDIWPGGSVLHAVAAQLVPGLDPTPAAQWMLDEGAGETLVWWEDGQPAAFVVLRTASRREQGYHLYLTVEAAACTPAASIHWPRYLAETQGYARSLRKAGIVLPINTRQHHLLRGALNAGLRIIHTRLRMATGPVLGAPEDVLLLTLAM